MDAKQEALVQSHLKSNAELKELYDNHLKLEKKLNKINQKPYLTAEEKVEKKRLQLEKLKGKTKIEAILEKLR
ncbi:MAG: DUF465 domain-containing protein [bacterium]